MIFLLPDNDNVYQLLVSLVQLLGVDGKQVEIVLADWNDRNGIEFDILQSVFPRVIPLVFDRDIAFKEPVAAFKGRLSTIVHFLIIAISVDASFRIVWANESAILSYFDRRLEVDCPDVMCEKIENLFDLYSFPRL